MPLKITSPLLAQNLSTIIFNTFEREALPVFQNECIDIARQMQTEIKFRIWYQMFDHQQLTLKYRLRKLKHNYDWRILVASRDYYDSIVVIKTKYGAKVGVKNRTHIETKLTKAGIPMWQIAEWLEFGTRYMPARPHWRPVIEKYQKQFGTTSKRFQKKAEEAVNNAFTEELKHHKDVRYIKGTYQSSDYIESD